MNGSRPMLIQAQRSLDMTCLLIDRGDFNAAAHHLSLSRDLVFKCRPHPTAQPAVADHSKNTGRYSACSEASSA